MFKYLMLLICLFSLSFAQEKKNVAVMEFDAKGVSTDEASMLADSFRAYLVNTGSFVVIDRSSMDKMLKEQSFQQSGCTSTECAVQIGQMLNMQYMFTGTFSKFGETYMVMINMINVETSQIDSAKQARVKGQMDALLDEIEILARDLASGGQVSSTKAEKPAKSEKKEKEPAVKPVKEKKEKVKKPAAKGSRKTLAVSLVSAGAGAALNVTGYILVRKARASYADYQKDFVIDFDQAWKSYKRRQVSGNIMNGTAYGLYALSTTLFIYWAAKGRKSQAIILPTADGVELAYLATF